MTERKYHMHDGKMGAAITVRVTPRASKNEISEVLDDGTVKIRLTAGPAETKTNQALVDFLAEVLQVPTTQVEIIAGISGKDKLVTINNLDAGTVQSRILRILSGA